MDFMTVIVLLGVILTVTCIAMLFLPFGAPYKTATQRFRGFGLNLEVSFLTAFLMIGVGMALAPLLIPFYHELKSVRTELEAARKDSELARGESAALRRALDRAQKFDVWALVTLDGETEATMPKPSDVQSKYFVSGVGDPITATVTWGVAVNQLRVHLTDVDRQTVIRRLIIEQPGKRRWVYDSFVPLEPAFVLKREAGGP